MRACWLSTVAMILTGYGAQGSDAAADAPATRPGGGETATQLPITEVTAFKDGHAFVLQEGPVRADATGRVILDQLPRPVLGTFWAYSAEPGVKLKSVTAAHRESSERRPAITIRDMLEANIGAVVHLYDHEGRDYLARSDGTSGRGTIVAVPRPRTPPPGPQETENPLRPAVGPQPEVGSIAVLKIDDATKVVPIERIRDVLFEGTPAREVSTPRWEGMLTLQLEGPPAGAAEGARVGITYLQRGLRWIPNYKVAIDGEGKAVIILQASLVNELADLKGVTLHLVVGVPTFTFKDTLDPIALQQVAARLGSHFQPDARTAYAFSNALMSQRTSESPVPERQEAGGESEETRPGQQEDLFIFTVENISLAKGERMVVPIAEYSLSYQDVYVLDIPWSPPVELRQHVRDPAELEMAKLTHAPKVVHRLRITNDGKFPLTTAPAMILQGNRPLAQGMMKYTAIGATGDLDVTTAVDIAAGRQDVETGRKPGAQKWHSVDLSRVDLAGTIKLTNRRREPVQVEVVRHLLGHVDKVEQGGEAVQIAPEDAWQSGVGQSPWWPHYSWPWWWFGVNGVSELKWKVTLEPGGKAELEYAWHYLWG